jgi:predicted Zn-dependent peptidase
MKWKLKALAAAAGGLSVGAGAMQAADVTQLSLPNGMKFILVESHTIPNANMYTYWKVGSRNEVPGITGLSHFFEHMMFNGSKNSDLSNSTAPWKLPAAQTMLTPIKMLRYIPTGSRLRRCQ